MGLGSVLGTAGGLDVEGIVSQLIYAEKAPIRSIDRRITGYKNKIESYNELNSKLSELLSSLESLNDDDTFSAKSTTSSSESVLTATASGSATEGTYLIEVHSLALYDNHVSDSSFTESSGAIGTGSFDLVVGGETTTITIDSTNNTLEGLKKAINASDAAVNAGIVNDGSGYRLTVTSEESGSASAISIQNNTLTLSDGTTPFTLTRTHDIASEAELDASLTVNGLDVTNSSNTVENVIEGVTLSLKNSSASTTTLTVSNDTESVKTSIESFVESYNEAYNFLNAQFSYIEGVGGGSLSSESLVRRIQLQLAEAVTGTVEGLSGSLTTLASAGIEMQNDGTLQIDSTALNSALEDDFEDLAGLFTALGETSHSQVSYVTSSSQTEGGTYQVDITAAAEAATVTSPNAIGATLGVDETLTLTMGSRDATVLLTSDMTLTDVVSAINTELEAQGISVTATESGSNLLLTSDSKGSKVSFTVLSNIDGSGTGIGTSGMSDTGVDVAGTLTNTETSEVFEASGSGEYLTGTTGDAKGLKVRFTGSSTGAFGTVTFSAGMAEKLERLTDSFTDSLEGPIHTTIEGFEDTIDSLEEQIESMELRLLSREEYLRAEFTRANQALAQMQSLQSTISGQLASLIR